MKIYKIQIDTVSSGREAIQRIKSGKVYDIIFMDHMMPEMDGMETTRQIRELGYTAPIVALTANAVTGQVDIFLQNGFDDFISKPIDIRQLDTVLNHLIRDKQPPEVIEAARQQRDKEEADSGNSSGENNEGSHSKLTVNKEIAGLDIPMGLERYEGDEKAYLTVLRSYAASVRSMLGSIENVSENNLEHYKIKVHGIKGTSFDIFAGKIGKEAEGLEEAANAGDLGFINEFNPAFLEAAWKLVADIEDFFTGLDADNPKPKKDKPDREVLFKLLEACKDYDMDEADAAMAEIEKYQYVSEEDLVKWLRDTIDRVDYAQITEKLSNLDN